MRWLRRLFGTPGLHPHVDDEDQRDRIHEAIGYLTGDELKVVRQLADRLVSGREQYGELVVATDRRDFDVELLQELLDACVYLTAKGTRA